MYMHVTLEIHGRLLVLSCARSTYFVVVVLSQHWQHGRGRCGSGGMGPAVHDIDRCCMEHDLCYRRVEKLGCHHLFKQALTLPLQNLPELQNSINSLQLD